MAPAFWGSEPITAKTGKFAGTSILQVERDTGLKLLASLTPEQRAKAVLSTAKTGNDAVGEAFKDNVVVPYAGVRGSELSPAQKKQLMALANEYVTNLRDDQARIQMVDVESHVDATHFAWKGGDTADSVFYYRIHSPVILIEFDHQRPAGLRHVFDPGKPMLEHIHTVVRIPNGNDYGKDLLREHYQAHPHPQGD